MDRLEALDLLRSQHLFPGTFSFRAVVAPEHVSETVEAVVAGAGEGAALEAVDEKPSRTGRWIALRIRLHVEDAEQVLDVYDVLRGMDHVVTSM